MEQSNHTDYLGRDKDAEIAALQAKCDAYDKERYETRLAMRMLLKVFKDAEKSAKQEKFYLQADYILDKYYHVDDVLRNEALSAGEGEKPEPLIPLAIYRQQGCENQKEDKQ
jgi:hypothetical protein